MKRSRWRMVVIGAFLIVIAYATIEFLGNFWQPKPPFPQPITAGEGVVLLGQVEGPRPGIDEAGYHHVSYGNKVAFFIWTDITRERGQSSGVTSPFNPGRHAGHFSAKSGETILAWESHLSDPAHGRVTIAGQTFRLEDGNLFLVSTRTTPSQVLQLRRDLAAAKGDDFRNIVRRLAEEDQIDQFFSIGPRDGT